MVLNISSLNFVVQEICQGISSDIEFVVGAEGIISEQP